MQIPRAEAIMESLITPRVLVRLLLAWLLVTGVGTFAAIATAVPGAVFTQSAQASGAMAPLWFDEFANTNIATLPDAREMFAQEDMATKPVVTATVQPTVPQEAPVLPTSIVITKLGIDLPIDNPTTTNVAVLDEALNDAVVRYPGSGTLNSNVNVLIFGHSSYLPVVRNPLYKAFNGIQNLTYGDEIQVQSDDTTYVYKVFNVRKANAEDDEIALQTGKRQITLLTCDSFGKKSDRFIVEAEFDRAF